MVIKIHTMLIKLLIILLIVTEIKTWSSDMVWMFWVTNSYPYPPNSFQTYFNISSGAVLGIQNRYTQEGSLYISLTSPSNVDLYTSHLLTNGSTYNWTAPQTGQYYFKILSTSALAPSFRVVYFINGQDMGIFYQSGSTTENCKTRRLHTRNQCVIQIDQTSYTTRTTTIDYVIMGDSSGTQKLSVGPTQIKNLTLNATMNTSYYLIKYCGGGNPFTMYHRTGSECNFSVPICGNDLTEYPQECDNGNGEGCKNCVVEEGYTCVLSWIDGTSSDCQLNVVCGNNVVQTGQDCDNGNQTGCINCTVNTGYSCSLKPPEYRESTCQSICGDGIRVSGEQCDNGNQVGCASCSIETGYQCLTAGLGSACSPICGDGILLSGQACDNGNQTGCVNCSVVTGYQCSTSGLGSACSSICGDGILVSGQACDNGNQTGCDSCLVATGYQCSPQGPGSVCTLAPVNTNPAGPAGPAGQNSVPDDQMAQMKKLEKSLQILIPVVFVILALLVIIIVYKSVKQFKKRKSKEMEVDNTKPDSSEIKFDVKNLQNQQKIQEKPSQL